VRLLPVIASLSLSIGVSVSVAAQQSRSTLSGKQLFAAACASCHGDDGKGAEPSRVGFSDQLPDFTDCSFASPETSQDWAAIVHEGGPVRSFSRRMPRFGAALSEKQIELVVAYIRSLCADKRWPHGELNLPRPMATEKAFPENETVFTSEAVARRGSRSAATAVVYERRYGPRHQIELAIPATTHERTSIEGGGWLAPGLGDVKVALKSVLYHSDDRGQILSLSNELGFPTGSRTRGFGSGTPAYEPTLLGAQLFPANFFLQFQTGVEIPFDETKAGREALARLAFGTSVGSQYGRSWSPIVELTTARELESGATAEWDVIPQMQVTLSRRQHIAFAAGVRLPLNQRAARPPTFVAYLLWDWFDGGFFEGWR
jgi:mono/diheme cytochrome c family protein